MVGQKEGILFGRRFCTSIEDLKEGIDVAVILTPAQTVPGILEACGKKKIRWAIVESGGFSEYSEEGAALEKRGPPHREKVGNTNGRAQWHRNY